LVGPVALPLAAALTCISAAFVLGAAAAREPDWAFEEFVDASSLLAAAGTGLSLVGLLPGKRRWVAAFALVLSAICWWIIIAVAYGGGLGWLRSFGR
jgi:hypothetical protein